MGAPRRPLSPRWPRLLLLLLGGLGRAHASLRLLDLPGPVCAQQSENLEEMSAGDGDHMSAWPDYEWYENGSSAGVTAGQTPQELRCIIENSSCFDDSWIRQEKLTPSPPKITQVRLYFAHTQHGELLPTLHVEWTLKGDSSFQTLKGAELSVLQLNTNERLCVKFKFLSMLTSTAWRFNFSHFVVEPGQTYEVTVNHLPRSGSNGDPNHESKSFSVPGCRDPRMKMTTPCVSSGSLWDPNLTAVLLGPRELGVLFTAWNESAPYQVLLNSFLRSENHSCHRHSVHVPAVPKENFQQRLNVTLSLLGSWCCRHHVQLQPFFSSCLNDCLRFSVTLDCPALADAVEPAADSLPLWAYVLVTSIALLLVAFVILFIARMTWRLAGSHHKKSSDATVDPDALPPAGLTPPPLKPKKVWIVYSADHPLYVDVVLKFAQFLLTVCGTEVALDLLEERVIAEVGVVTWVGRQKQEMVETGSKIIVLCSRGTRAKWQAMLGWGQPSVQLRCDHGKPAGDLFTAAMNVILPDFRKPACFGTYIVCYFSAISSESDVPELFDVTCRYPLMDGLEELYFRVQDLEMFAPGHRRRVGALAGENYLQSASGQQLKAALEHFRDWQAQHPDWFEQEDLGSVESQELPALDEDVAHEPLLPSGGGITRQWPLAREPAAQDCLVLDLLLREEGKGVAMLEAQPQPQGTPATQMLQTQVFPLETVPPAHVTEPVPHVGTGSSMAGRVVLMEPSEACPLPDGSDPRRNSVLFLSQVAHGPGLPQDVVRGQGGGWSLPVSQQSQGCPAKALWVSPSEGLKGPHGPSEEEQSDQGYISRGSPQPPETLSPEDLASLRSLQQLLFFQDLQKDSGWASVEAEAPAP